MTATVHVLAAVGRELRRLDHLAADLADRDTTPAVVSLVKSAAQDLTDAARMLDRELTL